MRLSANISQLCVTTQSISVFPINLSTTYHFLLQLCELPFSHRLMSFFLNIIPLDNISCNLIWICKIGRLQWILATVKSDNPFESNHIIGIDLSLFWLSNNNLKLVTCYMLKMSMHSTHPPHTLVY